MVEVDIIPQEGIYGSRMICDSNTGSCIFVRRKGFFPITWFEMWTPSDVTGEKVRRAMRIPVLFPFGKVVMKIFELLF